jgi:hypothetical protein
MTTRRIDYCVLAIIAIAYLAFVVNYQTVPRYIFIATIVFGIIYVIWGVIHHLKIKNFHTRVVLEYLLVAALGVALVSTLLL